MKKIRYIPYGYTMRNGRTVIAQDEAVVIRGIFSAYINGASLQSIAELLTESRELGTAARRCGGTGGIPPVLLFFCRRFLFQIKRKCRNADSIKLFDYILWRR